MKQLTRQEVEAVVERLANKTLSFGCLVLNEGVTSKYIHHIKHTECIQIDGDDGILTTTEFEVCKIIGHPITIGNVLEKMKEKSILYANAPSPREDDNAGWLLDYWDKCGFSNSLQEIISDSEWSHSAHAKVCNVGHEEVLTSPEANALFNFLQEIL